MGVFGRNGLGSLKEHGNWCTFKEWIGRRY